MDFILFGFVIASIVLVYTTYKFYVLLEAEKTVTAGLKSALNAILIERQQAKPKTTRKKTK
jgi:hypothetical protein